MSEVTEQPEVEQDPEITPSEVSDDAANPAGQRWDGEANRFVNGAARDEKGRFARVRASLERSRDASDYVKSVREGLIEADESLDPDTWAAARNAQLAKGTSKIMVPDFGPKPGKGSENPEDAAAEPHLTPEQQQHFEKHEEFIAGVAARNAIDPALADVKIGFQTAIEHLGVPPIAIDVLGHYLSDLPNPYEVLKALGQAPDAIASLAALHPEGMRRAVQQLSRELSQEKQQGPKKQTTQAPAPIEPVGARATAKAFDANDESLSADEWQKKRNEQVYGRRKY
jgi:hypothetical protein